MPTAPTGWRPRSTPPLPDLLEAAAELERALAEAAGADAAAGARGSPRGSNDEADELDTRDAAAHRGGACAACKRRASCELAGWRAMLQALGEPTPPEFVDWFAVERIDGRDLDVGMHRHWVDPTMPVRRAPSRCRRMAC